MQIQLKILAEEMQAISKGLEKVEQELTASENDGPISEIFQKVYLHNQLPMLYCTQVCWQKIMDMCVFLYEVYIIVMQAS